MIELTHDLNRVPNSDVNSPVFVAPGPKLTSTNGVYRSLDHGRRGQVASSVRHNVANAPSIDIPRGCHDELKLDPVRLGDSLHSHAGAVDDFGWAVHLRQIVDTTRVSDGKGTARREPGGNKRWAEDSVHLGVR